MQQSKFLGFVFLLGAFILYRTFFVPFLERGFFIHFADSQEENYQKVKFIKQFEA